MGLTTIPFPVLLLPRICSTLCEFGSDEVYLDVKITGVPMGYTIYSGNCKIKLVDSSSETTVLPIAYAVDSSPTSTGLTDTWGESSMSPYDNTPLTQNYTQQNQSYSFNQVQITNNYYLKPGNSQLSEADEIYEYDDIDFNTYRTEEEENFPFNDLHGKPVEEGVADDVILQQLLSSGVKPVKPYKTITYPAKKRDSTVTIQRVANPNECNTDFVPDYEDDTAPTTRSRKKYQCSKCNLIFNQISALRQHTKSHPLESSKTTWQLTCQECKKNFTSKEKYDNHRAGHGDPERECAKCFKIFASKFTLRAHQKIHNRAYKCNSCTCSYDKKSQLNSHVSKAHHLLICERCEFTGTSIDLASHQLSHEENQEYFDGLMPLAASEDFPDELLADVDAVDMHELLNLTEEDNAVGPTIDQWHNENINFKHYETAADIISSDSFFSKDFAKNDKSCKTCDKRFGRVSDLKRHLIEHYVRDILAQSPVDSNGGLQLICRLCSKPAFNRIDKFKAHMRTHANLTEYKCVPCDKNFSDSSNFSKHKKLHMKTLHQCDTCHRKFNSKKMIASHMERHKDNQSFPCLVCDKKFYFKSELNKHHKREHDEMATKFLCMICYHPFKTPKEKWDHEWKVHRLRKVIVDCRYCDAKFRKYSTLKRHCIAQHSVILPRAKKLLKKPLA